MYSNLIDVRKRPVSVLDRLKSIWNLTLYSSKYTRPHPRHIQRHTPTSESKGAHTHTHTHTHCILCTYIIYIYICRIHKAAAFAQKKDSGGLQQMHYVIHQTLTCSCGVKKFGELTIYTCHLAKPWGTSHFVYMFQMSLMNEAATWLEGG